MGEDGKKLKKGGCLFVFNSSRKSNLKHIGDIDISKALVNVPQIPTCLTDTSWQLQHQTKHDQQQEHNFAKD